MASSDPLPSRGRSWRARANGTSFDQLLAADAFLLGRKVYEGLASVWPTISDDTGFADRVNGIPKYVASRTLEEPLEWNASLIKGELAESVTSLKARHRGT
jgi:dihydrofolate reductase